MAASRSTTTRHTTASPTRTSRARRLKGIDHEGHGQASPGHAHRLHPAEGHRRAGVRRPPGRRAASSILLPSAASPPVEDVLHAFCRHRHQPVRQRLPCHLLGRQRDGAVRAGRVLRPQLRARDLPHDEGRRTAASASSEQAVGFLQGIVYAATYVLPILGGALADRYGYRRMLLVRVLAALPPATSPPATCRPTRWSSSRCW